MKYLPCGSLWKSLVGKLWRCSAPVQLLCKTNPYSCFCKPSFNFSTKISLTILIRPGSAWLVASETLVVEENRHQLNWVIFCIYKTAAEVIQQINSGDGRVQWIQWHYTNTHVLFWSDRRTNTNPDLGRSMQNCVGKWSFSTFTQL